MSRNSSGTYSLPNAPVVPDTVIDPDWANSTLNDLAAELTDSLSRSGKGGMLSHFRVIDGTAAIPSYSFTNEQDLGFYRAGTGDMRVVDGAANLMKWSATEVRCYKNFVAEGSATIATGLTVTAGGATIGAGDLAVNSGSATVSGPITSNAGINALMLKPGTADYVYMSLYARSASPATRSAYIGFGGAGDTFLTIANEIAGGTVKVSGGTNSTAADPTNALELTNGNLKLSGTAPNGDEALTNTLTPANMVKAWVKFSSLSGVITVHDSINITSVAVNGQNVKVTFAAAFANAHYVVFGIAETGLAVAPLVGNQTATDVVIAVSGTNFASDSRVVHLMFAGRQ